MTFVFDGQIVQRFFRFFSAKTKLKITLNEKKKIGIDNFVNFNLFIQWQNSFNSKL